MALLECEPLMLEQVVAVKDTDEVAEALKLLLAVKVTEVDAERDCVLLVVNVALLHALTERQAEAVNEGLGLAEDDAHTVAVPEAQPLPLPLKDAECVAECDTVTLVVNDADGEPLGENEERWEPLLLPEAELLQLAVVHAVTDGQTVAELEAHPLTEPLPESVPVLERLCVPLVVYVADGDPVDDIVAQWEALTLTVAQGLLVPEAVLEVEPEVDTDAQTVAVQDALPLCESVGESELVKIAEPVADNDGVCDTLPLSEAVPLAELESLNVIGEPLLVSVPLPLLLWVSDGEAVEVLAVELVGETVCV